MALGGWILSLVTVISMSAHATVVVEDVKYEDEVTVAGQKLVLNGAGLRRIKKFGMWFRVYTGGLYVTKKNCDAKAVIASEETRELRMTFLRGVDQKTLVDSMFESYAKDCAPTCKETEEQIKAFTKVIIDTKDGTTFWIRFLKGGVEAEMVTPKKEPSKVKVDGAAFSHNLMAMFIGDHPPTEEFKQALLCVGPSAIK